MLGNRHLFKVLVAAVLLFALVLRVGAVLEQSHYTPVADALSFDYIATSLTDGHGFGCSQMPPLSPAHCEPAAERAPFYPLVLAAVFEVVGTHPHRDLALAGSPEVASSGALTAGRLFNALLGMLDVALIGVVAAQLWRRRIALVAMLLAAIDPTLILVTTSIELEPLLIALCLAGLAAALQHRSRPRGWLWPAAAGLAFGLGALTRETTIVFFLPALWMVWSAGRTHGAAGRPRLLTARQLAAPGVMVLVTALSLVPWELRDAARLHAFVPVSTSDGVGLAWTYNETAEKASFQNFELIQPYQDPTIAHTLLTMHDPTEVKIDAAMRSAAIKTLKNHPAYVLKAATWNTARFFGLDNGHYDIFSAAYEPWSRTLTRASVYIDYLLFALALVGLFFKQARRIPLAIWWIPILGWLFVVFTLPSFIRYESITVEPFVVLFAAFPVLWVLERAFPLLFEGPAPRLDRHSEDTAVAAPRT